MPVQRQIRFWLAALVVAALTLYLLREVLLPFVAGMALAYVLDPVVDRLERLGLGRLGATILILALFILTFVLALVVLIPLVAHQLAGFGANLPAYVERIQALIAEQSGPLIEKLGGAAALPDMQQSIGGLVRQGAAWMAGFLRGLWSGGQAIISVFALLVVTPVVAFYLLVDWDHMVAAVDEWLPRQHRDTIRMLAREIDRAIAGFIRGQAVVCFILGTFYAVGLSLIGLNFGALIGVSAGLLSFMPYVGSLTGLVLSVGVAVVQLWPDWTWIGATLGIFITGQFIEGNILSPKLVGASVGLHPVWLMFALFAFGALLGFVGLLLAVPLAAIAGVLGRFALRQYLASTVYHGGRSGLPPGS
jgi:predicted PurR-regulated permease PerM